MDTNIALLQLHIVTGDIVGNTQNILNKVYKAAKKGATLCLTPELSLCGHPKIDEIPTIAPNCIISLNHIAKKCVNGPPIIVGSIETTPTNIYNTTFLIQHGQLHALCKKNFIQSFLPIEKELHVLSDENNGFCFSSINGQLFLVVTGYNTLVSQSFNVMIHNNNKIAKIEAILCLCSEPVIASNCDHFFHNLTAIAQKLNKPLYFCNHTGEDKNYIFCGGSQFISSQETKHSQSLFFQENCLVIHNHSSVSLRNMSLNSNELLWKALVHGIQYYVKKHGFLDVVLGLSGGIDSSVVSTLAVEALGAQHVHGVLMPSPWSSEGSITDAKLLANNLGIETHIVPIHSLMENFTNSLSKFFKGYPPDNTEENIQSRIRGMILMAISNKFRWMVLATGNKSERAVGYCTLYGDTCGGLAPIGDLYKTEVYLLARWYNQSQQKDIIPHNVLIKPPSAELHPGQLDQDSLPPYEELDRILQIILSKNSTSLHKELLNNPIVNNIKVLMQKNAFKRIQSPPPLIISNFPL